MQPLIILGLQCSIGLIVFFFLAKWYLFTKVTINNKLEILAFLLILNIFRYLPLSLFMPGQVSQDFPIYIKSTIAFGDFTSAFLAFIALLLIKNKNRLAIPMTWVFSIASVIDIILALTEAMSAKVYELYLGANYFIIVVYVPLLIVAQMAIFKILKLKS